MEYAEVKCRNCGSPIRVDRNATHIRCEFCGTEYVLSSHQNAYNPIQTIHYAQRGVLFQSYVPEGWRYRVIDDNASISALAPVCKGLQMDSPDGAQLLFLPFDYDKNRSSAMPSLFAALFGQKSGDYQLDPCTLACYCQLPADLQQYAVKRLAMIYGQPIVTPPAQLSLSPLSFEPLQEKAARFQQEASRKLEKPAVISPCKFSFSFQRNGQAYAGYFATILAHIPNNASAPSNAGGGIFDIMKKSVEIMGSMYGIGGVTSYDWGRAFDIFLITPAQKHADCEPVFDRFIRHIEYGPLYFALQDEELRSAQQVQLQGAMARQQNAIRTSQNISRTLSETSDIIHSGYEQRSQQMDRIYEKQSQAIRGVDTYTDSYGTAYEADVSFNHIYTNGNTFAGSKDGELNLGPDWEELKKAGY